jgi:hypothetical protein
LCVCVCVWERERERESITCSAPEKVRSRVKGLEVHSTEMCLSGSGRVVWKIRLIKWGQWCRMRGSLAGLNDKGKVYSWKTKARSQNWRQNGASLVFGRRDGFSFWGDIYGILGCTRQKSTIPRVFTMHITRACTNTNFKQAQIDWNQVCIWAVHELKWAKLTWMS